MGNKKQKWTINRPTWKEKKNALQVARKAHKGQVRVVGADEGKSYYKTHIMRVVRSLPLRSAPAGALHDVVEDTDVTLQDLRDMGLFSDYTLEAVDLLTRREGVEYDEYINRIATAEGLGASIARDVKIMDLMDNSLTYSGDGTRYLRALHVLTKPYHKPYVASKEDDDLD